MLLFGTAWQPCTCLATPYTYKKHARNIKVFSFRRRSGEHLSIAITSVEVGKFIITRDRSTDRPAGCTFHLPPLGKGRNFTPPFFGRTIISITWSFLALALTVLAQASVSCSAKICLALSVLGRVICLWYFNYVERVLSIVSLS